MTRYNKFYVALAGAVVSVALKAISNHLGIDLSAYEADIVQGATGVVTALLVYLVPNTQPEA